MTAKQQVAAIRNKLASTLPAALTSAGLQDFEDYLERPPNDRDKRQIGVYCTRDTDSTNQLLRLLVIHIELPGVRNEDDYHAVINPVVKQQITPELIDMVSRDEIDSLIFPIEPRDNSATIYYFMRYTSELDDFDD